MAPYLLASAALVVIAAQSIASGTVNGVTATSGAAIFALIMARYLTASLEAARLLRIAFDALDTQSDIETIQSFAGLLLLRDAMAAPETLTAFRDLSSEDEFVEAVERIHHRRELNGHLLAPYMTDDQKDSSARNS
jgi:hypothetical protein